MTVFTAAFSAVAFYEGRSTRLRHRLPEVRRERGRRRLPPGVRAQSGPETARALVTESFGPRATPAPKTNGARAPELGAAVP